MSQKKKDYSWLMLLGVIAAFFLIVYGVGHVLELFWHAPTVAMCDGKPMGPYDECGSYRAGSDTPQTTSDSKSQLQADQFGHTVYVYLTAFGIVVAVAAGIGILFAYLNNRQGDESNQHETHD